MMDARANFKLGELNSSYQRRVVEQTGSQLEGPDRTRSYLCDHACRGPLNNTPQRV